MNWNRLSLTLSLLAAGIGALSFAGWAFGIPALTRLHPAWVTMKANTALCLMLAGVAIALLRDEKVAGWLRWVAHACAVTIVAVGALTLAEIVGGYDFGFDQAFFYESQEMAGLSFPGRMGPASAVNFMLLGLGILTLDVRSPRGWGPSQFCALGLMAVTFLIFLASFYHVELPRAIEPYFTIALHTVIAFLLLAAALLLARPDRGLMTVFLAEDLGGDIARRMLPAALILPGLLGWACAAGREHGLYGRGVSTALLATSLTFILTALVWWMARALVASDASRRGAEAARNQLAAIVDSSDDSIASTDLDGTVTSWNAGAERLYGYPAKDIVGQSIARVIPAGRQDEEAAILRRLGAGERIEQYETVRLTADGREIPVSLTLSPVRDAAGTIVGASKIVRDISQQKHAEAALKLARDEAEAANRAKDDFLAVLSHELRTPLTPVLAATTEMEASPPSDPAELRENLAMIRRNIELEARLVDDLLDVTRIKHGKLRIQSVPVDLHVTLRDALAGVEPILREKGIALTTELADGPQPVRGDGARLAQVFSNLLGNAAKFTPEAGRIGVRTSRSAGQVRVEVSDSGIGIAADSLAGVFEPFRQEATTRLFGGLGLGLSVAKSLVEAHGGTIAVRSAGRGRGATFTVTLPVLATHTVPASTPASTPAPAQQTCALRVLLVEDHEDTRMILRRLLTRWGHTVTATGCVAEARLALADGTFDLLLSDVGLPDGTGMDVVTTLREKSGIPAVAMSGYGMEADIARTRDAGFEEHLVKPVAADVLRELVTRFSASADRPADRA